MSVYPRVVADAAGADIQVAREEVVLCAGSVGRATVKSEGSLTVVGIVEGPVRAAGAVLIYGELAGAMDIAKGG